MEDLGLLSEQVHLFDRRDWLLLSVQEGLELAEVFPERLVQVALMQRGGGVEHGEDEEVLDLERLPAHLHDADLLTHQRLHGEVAERADYLRLDQLDLLK